MTEAFNHPFSILNELQSSLKFSAGKMNDVLNDLEKRHYAKRVVISRCKTVEILPAGYRYPARREEDCGNLFSSLAN